MIKLAEHSGTGLVVVEGGVEKDTNDIKSMIDVIQVRKKSRSQCLERNMKRQR